jgi:(1->4)-alpha-D-glucan 1-alpha-D-glucosylmutase
MRLNAPLKRDLDGPSPDAADEVMLYQSIIGAWPLELSADDADGLEAFRTRIAAWQQKAWREAKRHSGWAAPNEAYEQACADFLAGVLDRERPAHVVQEIRAFVERIAAPGALNGLSQVLLRMTSPGVPDLYQGTEFWDFSLVDPDNRRPVDFAARAAALETDASPETLLANWRDGRIKQAVVHRALQFRAQNPALFQDGSYVPLKVEGHAADHVLAFARQWEERACITVCSRLSARQGVADRPMIAPETWRGTSVVLPRHWSGRGVNDVLVQQSGGEASVSAGGRLRVDMVLKNFPVALLELR